MKRVVHFLVDLILYWPKVSAGELWRRATSHPGDFWVQVRVSHELVRNSAPEALADEIAEAARQATLERLGR